MKAIVWAVLAEDVKSKGKGKTLTVSGVLTKYFASSTSHTVGIDCTAQPEVKK